MSNTPLERRKNRRVLIDGKLIAAHLTPEQHGTQSGYDYHYCRCDACLEGKHNRYKAPRVNRATITAEQQAELEHLVYEYQHMIGFGAGHKWACKRLGMDPEAVQRRLERNGYADLIQ